MQGSAFMGIWHGLRPAEDDRATEELVRDFSNWHTFEHMHERVGIPGFTFGARYAGHVDGAEQYFVIYVGEELGVFGSDAYQERLDNPTPWTMNNQPHFINFKRAACEIVHSEGAGLGGAIYTARIAGDGQTAMDSTAAQALARDLKGHHGVTAVHIGQTRSDVSGRETEERRLRASLGKAVNEDDFDGVVLVEGLGRDQLDLIRTDLDEDLRACGAISDFASAIYELSFALADTGV